MTQFHRTRARRWLSVAAGLFLAIAAFGFAGGLGKFSGLAHATPLVAEGITLPAPGPVQVDAKPMLGERSPGSPGWTVYLVKLKNLTAAPLGGTLFVTRANSLYAAPQVKEPLVQTTYHLAGNEEVTLQIPVPGDEARSVDLVAKSSDGTQLGVGRAEANQFDRPFLFSIDNPSPQVALIRDQTVPGPLAPAGNPPLTAGSELATLDQKTGEPVLPESPVGYSAATVVLASSEQLVKLHGAKLSALTSWVLAGGTLALSITRPEDLTHDTLGRLVGGPVERVPADPAQIAELVARYAAQGAPEPSAEELFGKGKNPNQSEGALPAGLLTKIFGFRGGNLGASAFGATASYGLGEVHLLSFRPNQLTEKIPSEWAQSKLLELLSHASYRTRTLVLPHARLPFDQGRDYWVRKAVDPNPRNHGFIVASALLLLLYALLAGPVNFQMAAAQGKPLRALYRLPYWSLGALCLVLVLGALSRGGSAMAKHLTLIEAGAGMPRGGALRFRAFYADALSNRAITVSETGAVIALAPQGDDTTGTLVASSTGLSVEKTRTKPWQTTLFREEGFANLGRGVSLLEEQGQLVIKNRLGRDLLGVVVRDLDGSLYTFDVLADGASKKAREGTRVLAISTLTPSGAQALELASFETQLEQASPGLSDAWRAFEVLRSEVVDWWPGDVPVLLGQIKGGEGRVDDSGIALSSDRVLLRVVGFGGAP